jgi:hypothetical protein
MNSCIPQNIVTYIEQAKINPSVMIIILVLSFIFIPSFIPIAQDYLVVPRGKHRK